MTNYDFSTLNDKDLEDLMCELLSSELSLRLQKFKSGKDGGVDLRYSTNSRNNSIVVQVKHYAGSGYKALLRELEKERVKIEKLETVERYIIATSVPLSPQNKDVIKSLLAPYVLSTSDIFGKEDINTLLTKFPYIEKNSYKLWLSSVNVMQTVLHNAVQGRSAFEEKRIRKNLSLYVITKDYNKALNILRVDKMLLISGMPGIGKTSLANLITYYVLSRGFQLVYIDDIREAEDLFITDNSKQLFYFDDFLGSNYLDIVHGNKSRSIVNFVDRIKESKNKFLILTTRSTILNQAKASDEKIGRSNISSNKCEIVIENYSDLDKAKILYNHLYHSDIEKSLVDVLFKCKRYWKIIKHKNYNPRLIEFFCKKQNGNDQFTPETYYEFVINTLDHPALIWERAINTQLNEEEVLLLHTLFSFGQSSVSQTQLESAYDRRIDYEVKNNGFKRGFTIFDKAFSNLLDGYIANIIYSKYYSLVDFINPSLRDYLLGYFNLHKDEKWRLLESVRYVPQVIRTFCTDGSQNKICIDKVDLQKFVEILEHIDFSFDNKDASIIDLCRYYSQMLNADTTKWLLPIIIARLRDLNYTAVHVNIQYLMDIIFKAYYDEDFKIFCTENKIDIIKLIMRNVSDLGRIERIKELCSMLLVNYDIIDGDIEEWTEVRMNAVNRIYKFESNKVWEEQMSSICDEESAVDVQKQIDDKFKEVSMSIMPIGYETLTAEYNPIDDVDIDEIIRENEIEDYESTKFEDYEFDRHSEASEESRIDDLFSR